MAADAQPPFQRRQCQSARGARPRRLLAVSNRFVALAKFPPHETFPRLNAIPLRNRALLRALSWRRNWIEETEMGKGLLLWLVGVPIPVIILLWLFFGR
jgi:hypothetical protein